MWRGDVRIIMMGPAGAGEVRKTTPDRGGVDGLGCTDAEVGFSDNVSAPTGRTRMDQAKVTDVRCCLTFDAVLLTSSGSTRVHGPEVSPR